MTAKLTPPMAEALDVAQASGGIVYRRGGFWTALDAEPSGLDRYGVDCDWSWWTRKGTVGALVTRGLLRWVRTEVYDRFESAAVLVRWSEVPQLPGGHPDVWQCGEDLCGALVRGPAAREAHVEAFHSEPLPATTGYDRALIAARARGEHPSNRQLLTALGIPIDPDAVDNDAQRPNYDPDWTRHA